MVFLKVIRWAIIFITRLQVKPLISNSIKISAIEIPGENRSRVINIIVQLLNVPLDEGHLVKLNDPNFHQSPLRQFSPFRIFANRLFMLSLCNIMFA